MRIAGIACAAVCLALAMPHPVAVGEEQVAAGMRAYVDPTTGALVPGPPTGKQSLLLPETAVSTSADGLSEQTAPGGGVMIDLQGRFNSHFAARVQPDGSVAADCHIEP